MTMTMTMIMKMIMKMTIEMIMIMTIEIKCYISRLIDYDFYKLKINNENKREEKNNE